VAEPLRILVVDDEPLAVDRLRHLLEGCDDAIVVGTAGDGDSAIAIARTCRPDLVLLDITMPGMDGIDVAHALSALTFNPAVVFVTAFDDFAVAAFDVAAIDYLMKPVDPARLRRALERVRAHFDSGRGAPGPTPARVEDFWVSDYSGLVRIAAADVERVTAERDYMRLHVGARSWLIHRTIAKLESDLDQNLFIRVHRSVILRRDTIVGLYRDESGHWAARLSNGGEQRIGRSYVEEVKRFAGR